MNAQHFASYFLHKEWSIGTSLNMSVNWYANERSNVLTFPVSLSLAKVQKVGIPPVRFAVQGSVHAGACIQMPLDKSGTSNSSSVRLSQS